jgi:signal transduction histidine kinase
MNSYPLQQVLVVEDDVAIRDFLIQLLESQNYFATGVSSIAETLELPNIGDFQVILLDWELPDGTADDLLPRIQTLAPNAASVVVTGDSNIEASIAALRHGAVDYMVKPISRHCLQASMARIELLRESKRRYALCERLATIGQAVTSVAHESRNALQRIQARVELMELDLAGDKDKLEDLRVIKAASQSLRYMFEELREFAAPIVLRKSCCRLHDIIHRAWQSLEVLPEAVSAKLGYGCDDIELMVDPIRLEQVFRNLFENALAACPAPARIDVTWTTVNHAGKDMLQIVVRDNGPGFSREQKEKAFEPFFTTKSKGTGLGLPICNRILESHQGWLEIGPDSKGGGCLMLALPVQATVEQSSVVTPGMCEVA